MRPVLVAVLALPLSVGTGSTGMMQPDPGFSSESPIIVRDDSIDLDFPEAYDRIFNVERSESRLAIKPNKNGRFSEISAFLWTIDGTSWNRADCTEVKRCELVMRWGQVAEVKITDNGKWFSRKGLKVRIKPPKPQWKDQDERRRLHFETGEKLTESKIVYGLTDSQKICRIGDKSPPVAHCAVKVLYRFEQ